MLSKSDPDLITLFEIPAVYFDNELKIVAANGWFESLFDPTIGQSIAEISTDFNHRKFTRKLSAHQPYSCMLFSAGDREIRYSLELRRQDQHYIGVATDASAAARADAMLASYSEMIEKQNRQIKAKTEQVNIWRDRIQKELEQAATVQDLLVPKHVSTDFLDSRCEPLQEMSGDFHEIATHADGQTTFISGDVAGKGIYAAIMLAQTLTAFRAVYACAKLTDVAAEMVSMLEDRFPDGLFVALTLIRQSADKQTVSVLNLGNPDVILMGDNGPVSFIASQGPAIGILPADYYAGLSEDQHTLTNKRLYVFTDGVLDAQLEGRQAEFADSAEVGQFLSELEQSTPDKPLEKLIKMVRQKKQIDDVTIACFCAKARGR